MVSRAQQLLLLMTIPLLSSCQVAGVAMQVVTGSVGCSVNSNPRADLAQGTTREIQLDFALNDAGIVHQIKQPAVCEYQGSICAGGEWFEVWYGDQTTTHTVKLSDDNVLRFTPHNFCMEIDPYEKECAQGACSASELFTIRLGYSRAVQEQRKLLDLDWKQGELTEFSLVNGTKLKNFGYDVTLYSVTVGDYQLPPTSQ